MNKSTRSHTDYYACASNENQAIKALNKNRFYINFNASVEDVKGGS